MLGAHVPRRAFATLKDIQMRLKAVRNIGKITKSMKMIAATRLSRAQRAMDAGRFFGATACAFVPHVLARANAASQLDGASDAAKNDVFATLPTTDSGWTDKILPQDEKAVLVACSSDRGLCGAIHSSVAKAARRACRERPQLAVAVLGDKARVQIARHSRDRLSLAVSNIGRTVPTITEAVAVWSALREVLLERSETQESESSLSQKPLPPVVLAYNRFVSAIAFETVVARLPSAEELQDAPSAARFEAGDDEGPPLMPDLAEFMGVARVYAALVEGHAAELSSKRSAMENATKNSEQMVNDLTLLYNRTRQAVITNELVDIIVGASAL